MISQSPRLHELDRLALLDLLARSLLPAPDSAAGAMPIYAGLGRERTGEMIELLPRATRRAAVLVPLVDRQQGLHVLFTERSAHLKDHAGQISFPGGRIEAQDADPCAAALRETAEEIGLDARHVEVLGYLPDHVVVTGYRVTPVVARVAPDHALTVDRNEVADVFEVPLAHLLNPDNHQPRIRYFGDRGFELTDLPYGERNIWGATAGMLMTLIDLLRQARGL
jgi:8-oxo-dGTP pyrophosphatase MutT (NUDIX family)